MTGDHRVRGRCAFWGFAAVCAFLPLACSDESAKRDSQGGAGGSAGAAAGRAGGEPTNAAGTSGVAGSVGGAGSAGSIGIAGAAGVSGATNSGGTAGAAAGGSGGSGGFAGVAPATQQPALARAELRDKGSLTTQKIWDPPPTVHQPTIAESSGLWLVSSNLIVNEMQSYTWLAEIANFGTELVCYPEAMVDVSEGPAGTVRLKMDAFSAALPYVDDQGKRFPCLPPGETTVLHGTGLITDGKLMFSALLHLELKWSSIAGAGNTPDPRTPSVTGWQAAAGDPWSVSATLVGNPAGAVYNVGFSAFPRKDGFLVERLDFTQLGTLEVSQSLPFKTTTTHQEFGQFRWLLSFTKAN